MFPINRLLRIGSNCRHLQSCRLKSSQKSNRLYYWNKILVLTNINETIGSHLDSTHKTQSLFRNKNLISMTEKGLFVLMPFVVKAMERLIQIIDQEMVSLNAQKIVMPSLVSKHLWDKSGRWDQSGEELFRLKDRNNTELCLAPTHEEVVTNLVAITKKLTKSHLPIYLYQITSKFRDELKAKHGLLRGREFLMKDLYTFDANESEAKNTYELVCNSYENIFKRLDLSFIKARGSVGSIGGKYSDEFLLASDLGEDLVYKCDSCQSAFNKELVETENEDKVKCLSCGSNQLSKLNAIEVGHSFLLGDKYSNKFNAKYLSSDSKNHISYEMGCFGLGVTRILAASVEVLSENNLMRWPLALAPFKICFVLPKRGSKEDVANGTQFSIDFANCLSDTLNEDILIDDRTNDTIGKRLTGLQTLGIPYIVVAGKRITEDIPKFEVIDCYNQRNNFLTQLESIQFFENILSFN